MEIFNLFYFLIAVAIFFGVFLISLKNLKVGLILLILSLPFTYKTDFSLGIDNLTPPRVVLLGVILSFVISLFLKGELKSFLKIIYKDKIALILVALLFVKALSIFFSLNLIVSLTFLAFFTTGFFIYFVLKYFSWRNSEELETLLKVYLIVGIVTFVFSFVQFYFYKVGSGLLNAVITPSIFRLGSFLGEPNHYAGFCLNILPLLAVYSAYEKKLSLKSILSLFFVLGVVALGWTFSRSGLLGFGVAALILISGLLYIKNWKTALRLFLLSAAGFFILNLSTGEYNKQLDQLAAKLNIKKIENVKEKLQAEVKTEEEPKPESITARAGSTIQSDEPSNEARIYIYSGALDLIVKYPILGVGIGSFNDHFRSLEEWEEFVKKDPIGDRRLPVHSFWLESLVETGVLGFVLTVSLMSLIVYRLFRASWTVKDKVAKNLNIAMLTGTLGILTAGLFYSYNEEFFWFFVFLAVLFADNSLTNKAFKSINKG